MSIITGGTPVRSLCLTQRVGYAVLALAGLVAIGCHGKSTQTGSANRQRTVAVVYTAPHDLINRVVRGFREGLNKELGEQVEILESHASGDFTQYGAKVDAALAEGPALIVPVTTPISQLALKRAPASVPVCFLAVTDPLGAGLVTTLDKPARCTGVSDLQPVGETLRLIRQVLPNAVKVGYPYNPEDQPARFALAQTKQLALPLKFEIIEKAVVSRDEVFSVAAELARTCDCLLIGSDNMMFDEAPTLVKAARSNRKALFANDSTSIQRGAVGGYTIDYDDVGRQGAAIAARILRGELPGEIPVVVLRTGVLELNVSSATEIGIHFPDSLKATAGKVHQ